MNLRSFPDKETLIRLSAKVDAEVCRVARAEPVDETARSRYAEFIRRGDHGSMTYLERYGEVRDDPRLLLDGAHSLIVCLFNYHTLEGLTRDASRHPLIAEYALGRDYHEVVKGRLYALAARLKELYGGEYRPCVDTAPLRERYWAERAGAGFIGLNNQLTVPGRGCHYVIGILLTTLEFEPDEPIKNQCDRCGRCVRSCPTHALRGDGTLNARRCLSYLTIENHEPLPDDINPGRRIFGCDQCRLACPHERGATPTPIKEFYPSPEVLTITDQDWREMTPSQFKRLFNHSPLRRATLPTLLQTLSRLTPPTAKT